MTFDPAIDLLGAIVLLGITTYSLMVFIGVFLPRRPAWFSKYGWLAATGLQILRFTVYVSVVYALMLLVQLGAWLWGVR